MAMGNFKKGEVVQLASGGPAMTISGIIEKTMERGELYHCQWFTLTKLEEGYFPAEALVIAKKRKPAKKVN